MSYSQRIILANVIRIVLVVVIFLAILYWATGVTIADIQSHWTDTVFITGCITLIFGFLAGMLETKLIQEGDLWLDKTLRAIKNALKGNLGEKQTFERLGQMLGDKYRIYRNFKIPGQKFDIDAVVVGPKGVMTFEIKNLGDKSKNDSFRFEGLDTYRVTRYPNGNECSCKMGKYGNQNPTQEAIRHNQALEEWLMKNGYENLHIKGAVLMVGAAKIDEIKDPAIYIIRGVDEIKKYFDGAFEDARFTPEFCASLNQHLGVIK